MQARSTVTDLRTGHQRWTVIETRSGSRAARALSNILVNLAVLVGSGPEPLDGSDDHLRVERLNALPGEYHPIQCARCKVLHQHVTAFDEPLELLFARLILGVKGDRALVVIQHGEIQAVHTRDVAQLLAGD